MSRALSISLSAANRPTKPGLYVMQEHDWEAPRMVRVYYGHTAGDEKPGKDLMCDDSRSHHHGHSPLNAKRADGDGEWQWSISPDALFSLPIKVKGRFAPSKT